MLYFKETTYRIIVTVTLCTTKTNICVCCVMVLSEPAVSLAALLSSAGNYCCYGVELTS